MIGIKQLALLLLPSPCPYIHPCSHGWREQLPSHTRQVPPRLSPVLTCELDDFAKGVSYAAKQRTWRCRKSTQGFPRSRSLSWCKVPQSSVTEHASGTVPGKRCDLVFSSLIYPDALPQCTVISRREVTSCH